MRPISGHTDPESAYSVDDYPYGFRERTTKRWWIETKKGFGQRVVSQTINPRTRRWNKPKYSTYSTMLTLVLDDEDHITTNGLRTYSGTDAIERFETFTAGHLDEHQLKALEYLKAAERAQARVTTTVHVCEPGCSRQHQNLKEQADLMHGLIGQEMRRGS